MKMYKLNSGSGKTNFCRPYINSQSPWYGERLRAGIYEKMHELPIIYTVENKNKPDDYHPTAGGILVSKKFMEVIKGVCQNIEILPSHMYFKGKERVFDEFYTIIFPIYEALDFEKSDVEWSEYNSKFIDRINKIVISKEKYNMLPPEDNIFHLKEEKVNLIVTETAKKAMENVGLVGVRFTELEVM